MKRYKEKDIEMIYHNISWLDISNHLGISIQSVYNWRNAEDINKHKAIDLAIQSIIKERNMQTQ